MENAGISSKMGIYRHKLTYKILVKKCFLFGMEKEKHLLSQVLWWTIQESNLLPPVRQTGALAK